MTASKRSSAREPEQHLVETRLPGTGKGVGELRLDTAIGDHKTVVVETGAQLGAGQLSKDGAFRRHRRVSLVCSVDRLDPHRACPIAQGCAANDDGTQAVIQALGIEAERW